MIWGYPYVGNLHIHLKSSPRHHVSRAYDFHLLLSQVPQARWAVLPGRDFLQTLQGFLWVNMILRHFEGSTNFFPGYVLIFFGRYNIFRV